MTTTRTELQRYITENSHGQFIVVGVQAGIVIPMAHKFLPDALGTVQYLLDNTELATLVPADQVSFTTEGDPIA